MRAGAVWAVAGVVLASWIVMAVAAGIAEAMVRRRMAELREMDEWREKVEAMRRIYEQEGDA